ncbi:MAG: N-acetyl-gamma-glutamyl-phosphate reductase [Chloroflexi bacterium]|nr:N-acetyl-gamma-glutamyl-phosphate reductase [Chloroflexota bacterium]MCY3581418.1 N-acetyl-gamma-glutamyl-phosphate reductase [Chloroflexota bacterium]MCY3715493.1 N-acetyl-gamma-glutamyl-phosphate reductase [Chloroflexota bacterium]MDE2651224.1 N-acetyl-gamma-glutamyl-phosphate reductase [Chloroflexota bacterium]MXV93931.1 N-acetyl-gamma-glutamyl-phosphate reductase [Chloroflexota bacterium]
MTKIRAGVYGGSGYAGLDLVEILSRHPGIDLVFATSKTYQGDPVPNTDLCFVAPDTAALDCVDVIFLALPHRASAAVAKRGIDAGVKVVDLSADLRLDSPEAYQAYYDSPHPHPELLPAPYGLPEINRAQLAGVDVVATPGCYPTTVLLGMYPLLRHNALSADAPVIVDAKSGVTGAGRKPSLTTHFAEVYSNLIPYKTGRSHRHIGELEQEAQKLSPQMGPIIFCPHLLPVDRGLMASIYVTLNDSFASSQAQDLFAEAYANEPLVDLLHNDKQATLKHAVKTNRCAISLTPVLDSYLHITSVTDNLRKGAASQAVQNMNLMFGIDETTGLL